MRPLALALALTPAGSARAQAPCPSSVIALFQPVAYSTAAAETTDAGRSASFDLRTGHVTLTHSGTLGAGYVDAIDTYRVMGPAAGTPVALTARFEVDGYSETFGCGGTGCYGTFSAEFQHEATLVSRSAQTHFCCRTDLREALEIPMTVPAGEPFQLRARLHFVRSPGANHHGAGSGDIRFAGLPAGAWVVSCHGFGSVVPTRSASWGQIKLRYH